MLRVFLILSSTAVVIAINVYLYCKILETNRKHRDNMRLHGAVSRTISKLEAIRTRLREQIKPTVSVLLLGGLDGIFNIILSLTFVSLSLVSNSLVRVYVVEFWVIPLQWLQILCHPLVYGLYMTAIRKKILDFELYHRIFSRRSQVIVISQQGHI